MSRHSFRSIAVVLLFSALVSANAALIDVDYHALATTPIGKSLKQILSNDGADDAFTTGLQRVMVSWQGEKAPPLIQYLGLDADQLAESLAARASEIKTSAGEASLLPHQPRFGLIPVSQDEAVVGTINNLNALALHNWPAPNGKVITFTGVPTDLKLEEYKDRISSFIITREADGKIQLRVFSPSNSSAESLMRWVNASRPLLAVAAGVGVAKADFPHRLVKKAKIERKGCVTTVDVDLSKDKTLLTEVDQYLADTLTSRMKKYSK